MSAKKREFVYLGLGLLLLGLAGYLTTYAYTIFQGEVSVNTAISFKPLANRGANLFGDHNGDGQIVVACLGDSNTSGVQVGVVSWCTKLDELVQPTAAFLSYGVPGATVSNVQSPNNLSSQLVFAAGTPQIPDLYLIAGGTNDIIFKDASSQVVSGITSLMAEAVSKGAKVAVLKVLPVFDPIQNAATFMTTIKRVNNEIAAAVPSAQLIDGGASFGSDKFLSDGLHLNQTGQNARALQVCQKLAPTGGCQ
jgi:lysophospholipase L1-like esterase